MRHWTYLAAVALLSSGLFVWAPACEDGGANQHQRGVGDEPGGVQVGVGDIAVAQQGYLLFEANNQLAVSWPGRGTVHQLPVEKPTRLSFADGRSIVYVHSAADNRLHAVDVEQREEVWRSEKLSLHASGDEEMDRQEALADKLRVESSRDDSRVVTTWGTQMMVMETDRGDRVAEKRFDRKVVDTTVLADSSRAVAVTEEEWEGEEEDEEPSSEVNVVELDDGEARSFDVPNCADKMAINSNSEYAFMAPTRCDKDPISVIDLEKGDEKFVENLPGFGPVEMAPQGDVAVGFVNASNVDADLFDNRAKIPPEPSDEDPKYYLMAINTTTLEFTLHAYGDDLPRYAMTPDGSVLLIDESADPDQPVRRFSTHSGMFETFDGPGLELTNFVMSSDSRRAYALDDGLFKLDIPGAEVVDIDTEFEPKNINIAPQDGHLFLRKNAKDLCVYSLANNACARTVPLADVVERTGPNGEIVHRPDDEEDDKTR